MLCLLKSSKFGALAKNRKRNQHYKNQRPKCFFITVHNVVSKNKQGGHEDAQNHRGDC